MSVSASGASITNVGAVSATEINSRSGYVGPTIVVQWNTFVDVAHGGRWTPAIEAGNQVDTAAAGNAWFHSGNVGGFLKAGSGSSDTTGFSYARWIIRGTNVSSGTTPLFTFQTQQRIEKGSYTNTGSTWTHQTYASFRGYVMSTSSWFQITGDDRTEFSITVSANDGVSTFRFGSVYLQFR